MISSEPVAPGSVPDSLGPILRSSALTLSAGMAGVLVALLTSIVVARSLGPRGKGEFDLALASIQLLALVVGLSLPGGITYVVAKRLAGTREVSLFVLLSAAIQGVVAFALVALVSDVASNEIFGLDSADNRLNILVGIGVGVTTASLGWRAILIGTERVPLASWLDVVARLVGLVALVIAYLVGGLTAISFLTAWLAGTFLGTLIALVPAAWRAVGPRSIAASTAIRFAAPSWLANLLQFLNYRLDLFLVGYFRDLRAVGLYALAATLAQLIWLVSNSVASVVFPRIAVADEPPLVAARRTASLARGVLFVGLALGACLAVAAPIAIPTLYGAEFRDALPALFLLIPGVVVFGPANVFGAHLAGVGKPRLNLWVSAISLVVTVLLDLLLIPRYGFVGAAIASTASYAVATMVMAALFSEVTGIGFLTIAIPSRRR